MKQNQVQNVIDYRDVLGLASEIENLMHSEFWGTTEGITWEDGEALKAMAAYALLTGYRYHTDVKTPLLIVTKVAASDYDSEPLDHKKMAERCLRKLLEYEKNHSSHYRAHDLAEQVYDLLYGHCRKMSVVPSAIEEAIDRGIEYERLVAYPMARYKPTEESDVVLYGNLIERLVEHEKEKGWRYVSKDR